MEEIEYKKMTKRMKDLTGIKIGSLKVIKYVGVTKNSKQSVWQCKCDCSNIKNYTTVELNRNKSCGCKRYSKGEDLIGRKFGLLTVEKKIGSKHKISIYKCKCDCGNYIEVYRTLLMSGDTKSCGCIQQDYYKNELPKQIDKYRIEGTNVAYIKSDKLSKANTSGIKGVSKKKNGKWLAQITFKRKHYNLGTYEKKEDAIKARQQAEEKLHKNFLREKGLIDDK